MLHVIRINISDMYDIDDAINDLNMTLLCLLNSLFIHSWDTSNRRFLLVADKSLEGH